MRSGSLPAGSSPRSTARSTITAVRARRSAQKATASPATSSDVAEAATRVRASRRPVSLPTLAVTARASARRSPARLPVSGTGTRCRLRSRIVSATRSAFVGQRRYTVVLCTPARAATSSMLRLSNPDSASTSVAAASTARRIRALRPPGRRSPTRVGSMGRRS